MQLPHSYLPIHVYSNVSNYFNSKRNKIESIFSSKLNADWVEIDTNPSFKRNPRELHYWKNREHYRKVLDFYKSNSVIFAKEAEDEAIALIKEEKSSLVAYYNEKNPDQLPYAERYMRFTGMEPKIPYNRHTLACLPAAFANVASTSSTSEVGLI